MTEKTRPGPFRDLRFTAILYITLFLIGTVLVSRLHPEFSSIEFFLNNRVLEFSRYPADEGHHYNLDVSGTVKDGLLIFGSLGTDMNHLRLPEAAELPAPFNIAVKVIWEESAVFSIRFAKSDDSSLTCGFDAKLNENIVFIENGGSREKLLDLPDFGQQDGGVFPLEIELFFDGRLIRVSLNGKSAEGVSPVEFDRGDFEFNVLSPCAWVLVDEVRITKVDASFKTGTVASAGFYFTPFFVDLPGLLGVDAASRFSWIFSLAALFLAAVLLDLLVLTGASLSRRTSSISLPWLLFLFLPLQTAACFFLRACFNLSSFSLLVCLVALTFLKATGLFRHDLVVENEPSPDAGSNSGKLRMTGAAAVLYAVFLLLEFPFPWTEGESASAAVYIIVSLIPLLLFLFTLRLFPDYPPAVFLLTSLQFFSFYLFRLSSGVLGGFSFSVLVLFPWMFATVVFVLKKRRRRSPASALIAYGILMLLVAYNETGFHKPLFLYKDLDPCRALGMLSWDAERHTSLLRRDADASSVTVMGRSYEREKPPGVFRIVCLGSSSTAGQGSTDMTNRSYPPQLENVLNETEGADYEVINGGIPGAPFYMLQIYFEQVLLPLDPDLLIIYFGSNRDNLASRNYYERMAEEVEKAPFISTNNELWVAMRLRWNPEFLIRGYFFAAKFRTFGMAVRFTDGIGNLFSPRRNLRDPDNIKRNMIYAAPADVVKAAIDRDCSVLLVPEVTFPDLYVGTRQHEYYRIFDQLTRKYGEHGVFYQDFYRFFTLESAGDYLIDDVHFHDSGYRWMAERFASILLARNLVPAVSVPGTAGIDLDKKRH